VAEVLRLFPEFSLEVYRKQAKWRDMDIEALREAGLK
jgi:hypothetical protein